MQEQILEKEKLKYLKWWDTLILTAILIGGAIISSNIQFFQTLQGQSIADVGTEEIIFTSADNIIGLINQGTRLIIALVYLYFRKFDFSQWKININLKQTLFALLLFLIIGALMDISYHIVYGGYDLTMLRGTTSIVDVLKDFSLLAYAMLNGSYEEIYFLGICLAVEPKHRFKYFLFSLFIRFSFHTYQGLFSATAIALILGIVYYLIYTKKNNNLYPFFLSHAIADVFGTSVLVFLTFM